MQLRKWQSECTELAIQKFNSGKRHFLCLATPGAGKTAMAAEVSCRLFKQNKIDFVLCFSPSIVVAKGIQETFERRIKRRLDGSIGAIGGSYTYQSMQFMSKDIWQLLQSHRVLVIFDEIHHCSGSDIENANAWGEEIISKIQGHATHTLALTGTPWRSDNTPIVLAEYKDADNNILCDYVYGLAEAINDKVCRVPQIIVSDNDDITLQTEDGSEESFESFVQLLSKSAYPYQNLVRQEILIRHILGEANRKLTAIRTVNPEAAGLVVASSVEHATQILNILRNELNQSAVIATYKENEPSQIINEFKSGTTPWIVSVGMISEGTDLPRLQVCCHLSRIKTELHFRQVLGRVLRVSKAPNQEAFLFMPAEPTLIDYAERVAEHIPPDHKVVTLKKIEESISVSDKKAKPFEPAIYNPPTIILEEDNGLVDLGSLGVESNGTRHSLSQSYEASLNVFGRFYQEVIALKPASTISTSG